MREKASRWTIQSGPKVRHARNSDKKSERKGDERKRGIETKTVENVRKNREEREKEKKREMRIALITPLLNY